MNWKNVLLLMSVNRKSSRAMQRDSFRRYRDSKTVTYVLYGLACLFGILIGWLVGSLYTGISDVAVRDSVLQGATYLFISLPTIVLLYGVVFTQMNQFRRIVKVTIQPMYWLPITWQEHTLASVLTNMLGAPMLITVFLSSAILVASFYLGLIYLSIVTVLALLATLVLASATTEIFKTTQIRLAGAITRVTGRAAIWLRLAASIISMIIFYAIYYSIYNQATPILLFEAVAGGQSALWFIPYVWLGMALSAFANSLWAGTILFSLATLMFIVAVFLAATRLNMRFGYEAPSIRISSGAYAPKVSLFGRLGFSPPEVALMKKDFRAITRRHELMFIFILPISVIIMMFFTTLRYGGSIPAGGSALLFALVTLLPGVFTAPFLGVFIMGLEGENVWYLHSSPLSAKTIARAKYFFVVIVDLAVTLICSVVSGIFFTPSLLLAMVILVEAALLIFALSAVSLACGFRGADYRGFFPVNRLLKPKWGLLNFFLCAATAVAIVAPMIPYALSILSGSLPTSFFSVISLPNYYVYAAMFLSIVIAVAITYVFRKLVLEGAARFRAEAEGI
ncbi:hypothetical protein G4O51_00320 [Candidatus Bathyarchaeota archaeon A05DMB-2]|jgi:predicted permease|nr:hypothetical protein [Candidatus Bathyarchaeota archaeon A05DMB-2]